MKKLILAFLSGLWCFAALAQNAKTDSLLRLVPKAKKDSNLVLLYIDIGNTYEANKPETAAKYYIRAKKLSEEIDYKKGYLRFAPRYSNLLATLGKEDSALIIDKKAIDVAKKVGNRIEIGKTYYNTGIVLAYLGLLDSTIVYLNRSKKYFGDDPEYTADINYVMTAVYMDLDRYDEARKAGEATLQYYRKINEPKLGYVLQNLGSLYSESGKHQNIEKARKLFNEAIEIAEKNQDYRLKSIVLIGLSDTYLINFQPDHPKVKIYAEEALAIAKKINSASRTSTAWRALGSYYLHTKNYEKALACMDSSLVVCEKNDLLDEKAFTLAKKSNVLFALGRPKEATIVSNEADDLNQKRIGEETQERIVLAEKRFETEKKEAQIKLQESKLKQKTLQISILVAVGVLSLVIFVLIYRNYSHRQKLQQIKIDELEKEKQLFAAQSLLKGQEEERSRIAKDLHDGLGGMLSGIKFSFQNMKQNLILTPDNARAFERGIDMLDSSIREMRRVAHNMMPEVLVNYGLDAALKEFCTEIDRSGAIEINYQSIGMEHAEIEKDTALTVYRIVQELVNNTLKHAAAKNILVQTHLHERLLSITVEDNGKGFDTAVLEQSNGIGWSNIKNRTDFLKGKIDLHSQIGKGTSVLIEIPV
ncbi:MAG: sensor histidine kinase [Flavobacteriaceae bacterium]|nr:sensor histidine kinase [Flavobacteriaceae bacterium]